MKHFRWAMALAAAVGYAGCGGSGCGGGSNVNTNTAMPTITCGPGTAQQGNTCVITTPVNSH
jgi:hypothetical protein